MKIESIWTSKIEGPVVLEDILVPAEESGKIAEAFIEAYGAKPTYPETMFAKDAIPIEITVALCLTEATETWKQVAKKIKGDGWSGASLSQWRLFAQSIKYTGTNSILLPGERYRDDELMEWVPRVHYNPRIFLRCATEISMRPSSVLALPKERTVLISKIKVLET